MTRFTVHSLGDGTFEGFCPAYPHITTIEDSFADALEAIQDLVEYEQETSAEPSYEWDI